MFSSSGPGLRVDADAAVPFLQGQRQQGLWEVAGPHRTEHSPPKPLLAHSEGVLALQHLGHMQTRLWT